MHRRRHPFGVGGALVDACVGFARAAGYARMRLWTTDRQVAARRIYLGRGFELTREEPARTFGDDLVGETYELDLAPRPVTVHRE